MNKVLFIYQAELEQKEHQRWTANYFICLFDMQNFCFLTHTLLLSSFSSLIQNFPLTQLAFGNHDNCELNILYKEQIGPARQWNARGFWAKGPPALETVAPRVTDNRRRHRREPPTRPPPTLSRMVPLFVQSTHYPDILIQIGTWGEPTKKCNHLHTKRNERLMDEPRTCRRS